MKKIKPLIPYLLLAPSAAFVLLFAGYPLVNQFVLSFQDFGLAQQFGAPAPWVGLANYVEVLGDPYFWQVLGKSLLFCAWTAGVTMILAVGLALLMKEASPWARTLLNTSFVVVWAMPMLAALTVWQWLVDPNFGLVNFVLATFGLEQFNGFSWLASSPWTFHLVASVIIIWGSMPLASISIHAALTQVDDALLEAAQLDGASYWKRLRHVIYPIISPVVALIGILQIIWDLRVFTQIHVLQQSGGISTETNLLGTYVYQMGISQSKYGLASAIATIILLVTVVITAKYIHMLYTRGDD